MSHDKQEYNIQTIRQLLREGFTQDELRRACIDSLALRPVVDNLDVNTSINDVADVVVNYCRRQRLFDDLLEVIKGQNPGQYAYFEDELYAMGQPQPTCPSSLGPNRIYRIISKDSGKCLDVQARSMADGANVQQYGCHNLDNQMWRLVQAGDGFWHIMAVHSGKCLEVENQGTGDKVNVRQKQFDGRDNQKWELVDAGDGTCRIVVKHSGKCLEVAGASADDGANVQQHRCHDGNNQTWRFEPVAESVLSTRQSLFPEWSQYSMEVIKKLAFDKRCPPLRVFISSTSRDLGDERQAVKRAVELCGCHLLLAEDAHMIVGKGRPDQIDYWLRDIDVLILLVSVRHGELNPSKLSRTEEEVRKAVSLSKCIIPYYIAKEIPACIESDEKKKKRLKKFTSWLTSLENQQPPQYPETVLDLAMRVARDIGALQSDRRVEAIRYVLLDAARKRIEREEQERRDSYEDGFVG